MGKNIFVGNLAFSVTEDALRELFSQYGSVDSARVITDPVSGRSKGFGFVEMSTDEMAGKAISGLSGQEYMGRPLTVNEARPQQPRPPRSGGGGGRGGFGGGGGGGRGGFGGGGGGGRDRRGGSRRDHD